MAFTAITWPVMACEGPLWPVLACQAKVNLWQIPVKC